MIPLSDPDLQRSTTPYINYLLIGSNLLVFMIQFLLLDQLGDLQFIYKYGVIPLEVTSGTAYTSLANLGQTIDIASPIPTWTTILSSMFLHGSFSHFAGNMLFLWVFGDNIEDYVGHIKYLVFYVLCGTAAALLQIVFTPTSQVPMIGASGAISGVMGAYILLYPNSRIKTLVWFIFITFMNIPAKVLLGIWFLLQIYNGLGSSSFASGGNVAYWAHIGGFIAGILIIKVFIASFRQNTGSRNYNRASVSRITTDQFSRWLESQLEHRGLSPVELATITDIDIKIVNEWLLNLSVPSQAESVFLAYALGISVESVLRVTEQNYNN